MDDNREVKVISVKDEQRNGKDVKIIVKEFKVVAKTADSFTGNDGKKVEYFKIIEPADENGENHTHSVYSSTLSELIEPQKEYRFEIQQTIGNSGYLQSKITNVGPAGTELVARESQSRFKKNYEQLNRIAAIEAAGKLVALKYAPVGDVFDVADKVLEWINGKTIQTSSSSDEKESKDKSLREIANSPSED